MVVDRCPLETQTKNFGKSVTKRIEQEHYLCSSRKMLSVHLQHCDLMKFRKIQEHTGMKNRYL